MAFIPCPNVAEFSMIYLNQGEKCENTYHVLNTGGWDPTSLGAMAAVFPQWEHDLCIAQRSTQCSLLQVHARDLTTEFGLELDATWAVSTVGTNAGAPLPNNVTLAVKATTGKAGRSFRGRTYWIGLTETMVTANGINVSPGNAIVAALNGLITRVNALGQDLVVLSRHAGGAPRAAGVPTGIASWQLTDPYVDSMRRRLPAHNRHH